jgi:hypothetical protein
MIAQHFIFENHKPEVLMDAFNECAVLWKKNGAKEVSLWRLQGSKINRFSFSVRCDDMEQMGKCMDNLAADADFAAWQMKYFGSSTIKENIIGRLVAEG